MPVLVQFGDTTFPVNPQSLSRAYQRALSRKNILGGHNATTIGRQKLESRHVSLTRVRLEGVLTGDNAKATMDALEVKFYERNVLTLITPTHYTGEEAVLSSLSFEVEKLKFYEKLIRFTAEFIIVPSAKLKKPTWKVLVKSIDNVNWMDITDVIDVEYDRQWGAQAGSFQFTADNSRGQYVYNNFDYGREVKIWLGYGALSFYPQFYGLIDTLDYDISKQEGSVVTVTGRDFGQRLLEGTNFYLEFAVLTYPSDMIKAILDGVPARGITATGVPLYTLGGPNWDYWAGVPWGSDTTSGKYLENFGGATRYEAIAKINNLYKMQSYLDVGEHNGTGKPSLIWFDKPRMSGLKQDAHIGDTSIYVDDPQLYYNSEWYGLSPNKILITDVTQWPYGDTLYVTNANVSTGQLSLSGSLTHNYSIMSSAYATTNSTAFSVAPYVYLWGTDISSFNIRINGVPMRNRIVYRNSAIPNSFAVADSNESQVTGALGVVLGPNPGYMSWLQTRYGAKTEFINDGAVRDAQIAKVAAYTELLKVELPDIEVSLTVPGNPTHFPGAFISFTIGNLRAGTGYILISVKERLSSGGGYTAELVCRRTIQTMAPDLLMGAIKYSAKNTAGQDGNKDTRGSGTQVGTVTSVVP